MERGTLGAASPGDRLGWRGRWLGALLATLLAAGCGPPPRPPLSEWQEAWRATHARLPEASRLEGPGARDVCTELLGLTHRARDELLPAPDEVLDRVVEAWIHRAGALAYDCPGAAGNAEAVGSAMRGLEELAAEIEAALGVAEAKRVS